MLYTLKSSKFGYDSIPVQHLKCCLPLDLIHISTNSRYRAISVLMVRLRAIKTECWTDGFFLCHLLNCFEYMWKRLIKTHNFQIVIYLSIFGVGGLAALNGTDELIWHYISSKFNISIDFKIYIFYLMVLSYLKSQPLR